jgi:CheY-like chemotaxis protein
MIVFIDDERWVIEGYIDRFNVKKDNDKRYELKYFKYPKDAWQFLRENRENIDLIILDIALDYGDGNILNEVDGGIQFLNEIKKETEFNRIPILIYSVVPQDKIERDSGLYINDENNLDYLNRDCKDEEFYNRVEDLLNRQF